MICKHNSLVVAETILHLLINDERSENMDGTVRVFDNCRQQGFSISFHKIKSDKEFTYPYPAVTFSENRNSDEIVLYFGPRFNTKITEESYQNREFLSPGDYSKAVDRIFEYFGVKY